MTNPMTEKQLQLRRELEPIIKRFRSYAITMRDAMTEIEVVFESRLAEANKRVEELEAEQTRSDQILIAVGSNVGCGDPRWHEIEEMIEQHRLIRAELEEPIIVDLTNPTEEQ